jgi:uncharacterized protein YbaP (TraB family)
LIEKEKFFFPDKYLQCFNSSKTVILETDIDIPLSQQIELLKKVLLPDNKELKDFMTDDNFSRFSTYYLDSFKVSKSTFRKIQKIKPIFASALVLNDFLKNPVAYEQEFSKMAKHNKMTTEFLESIDYQMEVVGKITVEQQVKMMYIVQLSDNPKSEYEKMISAYLLQDLESLQQLFSESVDFQEIENDLLTVRNLNWIPIIDQKMKEKSCFIAVGAGHLAGKDGVIELLKQKGYDVNPVRN